MQLKRNPYHLLLLTALLLFLSSFLVRQGKTVDIHLHDTYIVIAQAHVMWLFTSMVWLLWLLYLLTRKLLYSQSLTWVHVIITLVTVVLLVFPLYFGSSMFEAPVRRENDHSNWSAFEEYSRNIKIFSYCIAALIFGQVTFAINLVAGLFKRVK